MQAAFDAADPKQAQTEAETFTRAELRVVEPKPSEILSGVRFYLGLKNLMRIEKANAFTIDCFGTLPANTLPGYPCIAWSKLNDAGLYGVCEADLHSTMTQLLVTSYAGVPGFVSDPVFDVGRNEVIHAHWFRMMYGDAGSEGPFIQLFFCTSCTQKALENGLVRAYSHTGYSAPVLGCGSGRSGRGSCPQGSIASAATHGFCRSAPEIT